MMDKRVARKVQKKDKQHKTKNKVTKTEKEIIEWKKKRARCGTITEKRDKKWKIHFCYHRLSE